MTSISETGHAKNVANFDQMITSVASFGTLYKPSRPELQIPALQTLATSARTSLNKVDAALPAFKNAVAAREVKFEPLSKLATRLLNAVKSTSTTEAVDDNVQALVHKIQGAKATPKLTEEEKTTLAAEGKSTKEISVSQMSYDSRLENLNKLVLQLGSIPEYKPNEPELQVATLRQLYNDMSTLNSAVVTAEKTLDNARIARNEVLYKSLSGLVDISADVKTYVKSVFGASAAQFKQVSKLEFNVVKS
ncbi:hypothetical protein [Paludibacter sp.]|uniref:hypothetical protein n=1 Tax=Paludibacter sp. TaxID=1898105 RepID=UPI001352334C|nr:hypothetical protein [Paludibacter sp.]MTK52084.1 hypothetical protein [Paludibacter sp.]